MKTQLNLPIISDMDGMMDVICRSLENVIPSRLDMLDGKQVLFTNDRALKPIGGWDMVDCNSVPLVHRLERIEEPRWIVAVDSSCVLIGETVDGFIYSAKCSIAFSYNGRPITHALIGPLLFYIQDGREDIEDVKRMIRVRLERLAQYELSASLNDTILLVDGSLRHSIHEHNSMLNGIMSECKTNGNMLIGLSKSTRLRYLEPMISLLSREGYPCYVDVTALVEGYCKKVLVDSRDECYPHSRDYRVYSLLTKLTMNGFVLRADTLDDPAIPLGILITNDTFHNGYPGSLRIAHHTSLFTHTDMLCIKGFIKSRFNVKEVDGDDVRRVILGRI